MNKNNNKNLKELYPSFTQENRDVWQETIHQKNIFLQEYSEFIYAPFLAGYNYLNFTPENIPTREFLIERLSTIGWRPIFVNGYLQTKVYVELLLEKKVPISTYVRSKKHLTYSPAPDFIHDLIGHLPMLFDQEYVNYLFYICTCIHSVEPTEIDTSLYIAQKKLGDLGNNVTEDADQIKDIENEINMIERKLNHSPTKLHELARLFLWTIEFGVMLSNNTPKLYGAGLMSSTLEATSICQGNVKVLPFSLEHIMSKFNFSNLQEHIFASTSFNELQKTINSLMHGRQYAIT